MSKTPYLGLDVNAAGNTSRTFLDYRLALSGDQSGSNMQIIDNKIKNMDSNTDTMRAVLDAKDEELEKKYLVIRNNQTAPYTWKGKVAEANLLPTEDNEVGDTYYVDNLKYRMTWGENGWAQSSMDESAYLDELGALNNAVIDQEDITAENLQLSMEHFLSTVEGNLGRIAALAGSPDVAASAENYAAEFVYIRVRAGDVVCLTPGTGMGVRVVAYQPVFDLETNSWTMTATEALQTTYGTTDVTIPEDCFIRYGMRRTDRGAFTLEDALGAVTIKRNRNRAEGLTSGNILDLASGVRNKGFYQDASLGETEEMPHTLNYLSELQPIPVVPGVEYTLAGTYHQALGFLSKGSNSRSYVKLRACDKSGAVLYKNVWYFGMSGKKMSYRSTVATRAALPHVVTANYMYYIQDEDKRVYSKQTNGVWGWENIGANERIFRAGTRSTATDMPSPAWAKDTVYVEDIQKLMEYNGEEWVLIEDEIPLCETLVFPTGVDHVIINYPDRAMPDISLTTYTAKDYIARQQIGDLKRRMDEVEQIKGTIRKNNPSMVREFLDVAKSYLNQETLDPDPTFGRYASLTTAEKRKHWYDAVVTDPETGMPMTNPETGNPVTERHYYGLVYGYQSPLNMYFGEPSYGSRLIDCSSYVGMVLRGISFDESAYKASQSGEASSDSTDESTSDDSSELQSPIDGDEENNAIIEFDPFSNLANPKYTWSLNPYEWSNLLNRYTVSLESSIRGASQIAHWMADRGQEVPLDNHLSNIEPGDIVFYTRFDRLEPIRMYHVEQRYRHINHCAIITEKILVEDGAFDSNGNMCVYENGEIVGVQTWDGESVEYSGELWDAEKYPYLHRFIQVNNVPGACEMGILETSGGTALTGNNINTLSMCCRPDLGAMSGPIEQKSGTLSGNTPDGYLRFDNEYLYLKTSDGWKRIPLEAID